MKQIALQTVEGLTQSIKGLARTKTDLPQQEGVLPADGLRARAAQFPGLSLHTHTHTLLLLFLWRTLTNTEHNGNCL